MAITNGFRKFLDYYTGYHDDYLMRVTENIFDIHLTNKVEYWHEIRIQIKDGPYPRILEFTDDNTCGVLSRIEGPYIHRILETYNNHPKFPIELGSVRCMDTDQVLNDYLRYASVIKINDKYVILYDDYHHMQCIFRHATFPEHPQVFQVYLATLSEFILLPFDDWDKISNLLDTLCTDDIIRREDS